MTMKKTIIASSIIASIFAAPAALAFKEYPAGEPIKINDMEIAAVYLQPIDMEPRGMGYLRQKLISTWKRIFTPPKVIKMASVQVNGYRT